MSRRVLLSSFVLLLLAFKLPGNMYIHSIWAASHSYCGVERGVQA